MRKRKIRKVYLAGPMEYAANSGRNWRLRYSQELKKLDIESVIPEFEEKFITNQVELNRLKEENTDEYILIMRKLIDLDLNFVNNVDAVIVRWEGERMSGTIGEVQHAYLTGTPAYLVTSKPMKEVPGWFLACFTMTFPDLKTLTSYIKE